MAAQAICAPSPLPPARLRADKPLRIRLALSSWEIFSQICALVRARPAAATTGHWEAGDKMRAAAAVTPAQ